MSRQKAENVRCEVADAAGNRELNHGARQPEVGFLQPEVGFCIIGQWFYPNVRQIFFIRERTLSSTILVAFRHVKGEKVSLQVDGRR